METKKRVRMRSVLASVLLILIFVAGGGVISQAVVFASALSALKSSSLSAVSEAKTERIVADIEKHLEIPPDGTLAEKLVSGALRGAVRTILQTTWLCDSH